MPGVPSVAVVGAGYWGRNLVRVFHQEQALRTICESDEGRGAALRAAYPGIPLLRSYDEVLSDASLDAIVLATPADRHAEMARQALEAGKHVFVEKPLALKIDE